MKPSQIAQSLRHIASKIQNSKQPDRRLVARDLKRILAALNPGIQITNLDIDEGDKRSYGHLDVTANTLHGILNVKGLIASDSTLEEVEVTLNGKPAPSDIFPDPEIEHGYYSSHHGYGERQEERQEELKTLPGTAEDRVLESIRSWCTAYQEMLDNGLV